MRKQHIIAAGVLLLMLMTSCSNSGSVKNSATNSSSSNISVTETSGDSSVIEQAEESEIKCMPLISIKTVSQEKDVMDFVTKPINRFVSKSIASWTPGYVIPPEPYSEVCTAELKDSNGQILLSETEAEVMVRGNWTTNYEKKPLKIKFKEKQNLAGMNEGGKMRNWVLLAEYKDASMLRNKSALYISREILKPDGYYASDAQFAEVEINGEYWGVYLLAELQQVNPLRVNINEPEKDYQGTDIGYLMEFDGYFRNEDKLNQFQIDYADNAELIPFDGKGGSGKKIKCQPERSYDRKQEVGIKINSDINSQEQHDFIADYVNNVYRIMYSAAYEKKALVFDSDYKTISESKDITPEEAVKTVVDVQSLANMYIVSELTCDADIYWSSFFMDVDFSSSGNKKLRFEAPWDFDSSMGNKDRCADGTGFYAANIVPDVNANAYETINPWLAVLMNEEWFQNIVREKWTKIYDQGIFGSAIDMIENDKNEYKPAFERNYKRWNNLIDKSAFEQELSAGAAACRTHEEAADYLSSWLGKRVEFLNDYWHS